jgi:tetratricopeptide (TPR) repeat protein
VAEASTTSAQASELAQRSIKLLKQGEDSPDPAAKERLYREGLDLAQRAVAADDTNADAHFALFANLGRVMLAEGAVPNPFNLLRVNRELERTLELNPDHSDALAAQGGMYRQLPRLLGGSLTKAEHCLQRSIALDSNAVGARIELARTYQDMGEPERGVTLLRDAIVVAERAGKWRQIAEARRLLEEIQPVASLQLSAER